MSKFNEFGGTSDPVQRDQYGRPVVPAPDGEMVSYTRASTLAGVPDDRFALEQWIVRMAALGFVERPDLMAEVAQLAPQANQNKKRLNEICEAAGEQGGAKWKSSVGTWFHDVTEAIDRGHEPEGIPAEHLVMIDAYRRTTAGIEWEVIEKMMLCHEIQVAGTPDRLGRKRGPRGGKGSGKLRVYDLKTGTVKAQSSAIQLACYAHGTEFWNGTETTPAPEMDLDVATLIWLPFDQPGRCELIDLDIRAGWEAAKDIAKPTMEWRKRKDLILQSTDKVDMLEEVRTWLVRRLQAIGQNPEAAALVTANWPATLQAPQEGLRPYDVPLIRSILDFAEDQTGMTFSEVYPGTPRRGTAVNKAEPKKAAPKAAPKKATPKKVAATKAAATQTKRTRTRKKAAS